MYTNQKEHEVCF